MEWARYLAVGVPPVKRALIGGNWKCNGTLKEVTQLVERLNSSGPYPLESEVLRCYHHISILLSAFVIKYD